VTPAYVKLMGTALQIRKGFLAINKAVKSIIPSLKIQKMKMNLIYLHPPNSASTPHPSAGPKHERSKYSSARSTENCLRQSSKRNLKQLSKANSQCKEFFLNPTQKVSTAYLSEMQCQERNHTIYSKPPDRNN
jgi:hypothetical protein